MHLEELLYSIKKPGRYLGNEINIVRKDWHKAELRMALIFPDLYEIGMSHLGTQILYHVINSKENLLAERAYVPDTDLEKLLRRKGELLFSLESHRPLMDFDVIGITLPYELCYGNILTVLDLSGIPFYARDRKDMHPLVIGGGSCSLNPEPVADFFDAVLLGDGEEAILEIVEIIRRGKAAGQGRTEIIDQLTSVSGVYVPSLFRPHYDKSGKVTKIESFKAGYQRVARRILPDLDSALAPQRPLVPLAKIIHDRLGVEIARGCTRGCRFCQAGIIYRPVRERSPLKIKQLVQSGIDASGFDELALLSLSTGDYSCLSELLRELMDSLADRKVSVSMPSMRVGTLSPEIMVQIQRVKKTGFTVAPEAGTDRMRRVINKGISEEDLLETCRAAFSLGWKLIKFYFMIGLPLETIEDIEAIPLIARRAVKTAGRGGCSINVSTSIFVPKPHTPFQWEPQISIEEGFSRIDLLKRGLPRKGFKLKWHDPRQSFLEGVFSRGDRRLAAVIEQAWFRGARLDGWSEHFDLQTWLEAGETCKIDYGQYLRRRDFDEILPWQHLDAGIDQSFLKSEYAKAVAEEATFDCRLHGCQKCGVCDLKIIKPIVYSGRKGEREFFSSTANHGIEPRTEPARREDHYKYRIHYVRLGEARFLSHLDLIQVFFRTFRRLRMKINFSQGFNPSPKVSFSPALPVGTESLAEFLDIDLAEPLDEPVGLVVRMNGQLPPDLEIRDIEQFFSSPPCAATSVLTCYRIKLPRQPSATEKRKIADFMHTQNFFVKRQRKNGTTNLDIRPLVKEMETKDDGNIELVMCSESGKASSKPSELLQAVLDLNGEDAQNARVLKLWWRNTDSKRKKAQTTQAV